MEIASKYILDSAVNKERVREGQDDGQDGARGAETARVSQERRDGFVQRHSVFCRKCQIMCNTWRLQMN